MAEQKTDGVKNKKLLLVATLAAVVTVTIYNIQVWKIKREAVGDVVKVLQYKNDIASGNIPQPGQLEIVPVPKRFRDSLGDMIMDDTQIDFVTNRALNQPVSKGQFVLATQITDDPMHSPSRLIAKGDVVLTIAVDSQKSPPLLRVGDRVNIFGMLSVNNSPPSYTRIINGVLVHGVGGRVAAEYGGVKPTAGQGSFDKISIEVNKNIAMPLENVLSHVVGGKVDIESRSANEAMGDTASDPDGKINTALSELAKTAGGHDVAGKEGE